MADEGDRSIRFRERAVPSAMIPLFMLFRIGPMRGLRRMEGPGRKGPNRDERYKAAREVSFFRHAAPPSDPGRDAAGESGVCFQTCRSKRNHFWFFRPVFQKEADARRAR